MNHQRPSPPGNTSSSSHRTFVVVLIAALVTAFVALGSFRHQDKEEAISQGVLSCPRLKSYSQEFLRRHYVYKKFDEDLSRRTFQRYFQFLDPGKNFFLESDLLDFSDYEKKLPELLNHSQCDPLDKIAQRLHQRVIESEALVNQILVHPLVFSTPEFIETDRKKNAWAPSPAALAERWRLQLKFLAIGMAEADGKMPAWNDLRIRLQHRYNVIKKSSLERSQDDLRSLFLNAFATALDPHSQYMLPEDQDEFKSMFSLQLTGIGAQLSQVDGYTVIESILPGGSAERDGRLQKGDKIVAVESAQGQGAVDVIDKDLSKVVQLIRGEKGTLVGLTVLRKTGSEASGVQRLTFLLTRDIVHLADQQAQSQVITLPSGKRMGVLLLPSFYIDYDGKNAQQKDYRSSAGDSEKEIKKLKEQKIDGLVVDLRKNGGGDLSECVHFTGLFIDKGPVVQVRDGRGDVDNLSDTAAGALYTGPLGVLVSRQSASASEIFAGAIQDYGRGLILGSPQTYGKGTVQNVIDLDGTQGRETNGALKVTISKFYRPSGASNQSRGVRSDVVIPDAADTPDIAESENEFALPYDTIDPQRRFRPLQAWHGVLDELRARSAKRTENSKDFLNIKESLLKNQKENQKTLFSLLWPPTPKSPEVSNLLKVTKKDQALSHGVIKEDDIQLREAAQILEDASNLIQKGDWVTP